MSTPKHIRRFWLWVALLALVEVAAITLWHRWPRLFPSREVSEAYTRYAGTDGLQVAFVKDYRVNDTVSVDVTLLETSDTNIWNTLCLDFGIMPLDSFPTEYKDKLTSSDVYGLRVIDDTIGHNKDNDIKTIVIFSYLHHTMGVFSDMNRHQYDAIIDQKTKEISNQQNF